MRLFGRNSLTLLITVCWLSGCGSVTPGQLYLKADRLQRGGELSAAREVAETGLNRFGRDADSDWHWKFLLLQSETLLIERLTERAEASLYPKPPLAPTSPEMRARLLVDQAWLKDFRSQRAESLALLDQAEALVKNGDYRRIRFEIDLHRGSVFAHLRKSDEAEMKFRSALKRGEDLNDGYLQSLALGNLAVQRMDAARYDEAISILIRAMNVQQDSPAKGFTIRTLNNLGNCYYRLGDFDKAASLFEKVHEMASAAHLPMDYQMSLGNIGNSHVARAEGAIADPARAKEEFTLARNYYTQALAGARKLQVPRWTGMWLSNLAKTSLDLGDIADAEKYNAEAERIFDDPKTVEHQIARLNAGLIAEMRLNSGQAEQVFRSIVDSHITEPAALLPAQRELAKFLVSAGRNHEAETEFRKGLKMVESSRSRLVGDEYKLSYLSSLIGLYQDYVDFLIRNNHSEEALQVAESSRGRVLAERLRLGMPVDAGVNLNLLRQHSRVHGVIMLSYWLAPGRSFLWVITPSGVRCFTLPSEVEIIRLLREYRALVESLKDPLAGGNPTGRKLFDTLIGPASKLIPKNAKIVIVPDRDLYNLNFETLPAGGDQAHYWIEDVTISVTPSLTILANPQPARREKTRGLLLIGNPISPDEKEYPKLASAAVEVNAIQKTLAGPENVILTGAEAQPEAYLESHPERFAMIHFAAHATANRDNPLDSAVILTRHGDSFKLYARDIVGHPIQAGLVTISACQSAGSRSYAGEGLIGFAWAFLQAGARDVIAGLWAVDDRSTAILMERTYAELHAGKSPAEALRTAKLDLLHSSQPMRKPYYWGPFEVFASELDPR